VVAADDMPEIVALQDAHVEIVERQRKIGEAERIAVELDERGLA